LRHRAKCTKSNLLRGRIAVLSPFATANTFVRLVNWLWFQGFRVLITPPAPPILPFTTGLAGRPYNSVEPPCYIAS